MHFYPVQRGGFRISSQLFRALLHDYMTALCKSRHHDIFLGGLFVGLQSPVNPVTQFYRTLRMCHTGGHADDHRRIKLLGDLIRQLYIFLAFAGIGGL